MAPVEFEEQLKKAKCTIVKEKLGELEINYAAFPAGSSSSDNCSSCSDPPVISAFPWLKSMVSCFADFGSVSGRIVTRVLT